MKNLSLSIANKDATIGIVGLGYVGLPLAIQFLNNGFNVIGYDVDSAKVKLLEKGGKLHKPYRIQPNNGLCIQR